MCELKSGTILNNGKYRIDEKIGQGGFGITYSGAVVVTLEGGLGLMSEEVKVAIKEFFMKDKCTRSSDGVTMEVTAVRSKLVERYKNKFIKEAQKLSTVDHPNIVEVMDIFQENNTVYYVMRYLAGGSLAELVDRHPKKRLSEELAIKYVSQIGKALSYLHDERKMCHYDVKPQNILLNGKGEAILIDFGIAKTYGDGHSSESTNTVSYSNHYAPKEQYEALKEFSPQTDLYSLGATLYFLITGKDPDNANNLYEKGFPSCPSGVNPHLWQIISLAMKPKRSERPESVEAWLDLLQKVKTSSMPLPPKPTPRPKPVRPVPKPSPTPLKGFRRQLHVLWSRFGSLFIIIAAALVGTFVALALFIPLFSSSHLEPNLAPESPLTTAEAINDLGSTTISGERLHSLSTDDKLINHNGNYKQEDTLKQRLATLNLIYDEFAATSHRVSKLSEAYSSGAAYLSPAQRKIMLKFFNLPKAKREKWESINTCVGSFDEFQAAMDLN